LHKRFRRAALLRRYARQFSLLVRGQLHFHSRPFYCARSSPQARLHARRASNARKCCGVARMARFEPFPHKHLHPVHTNQNAVAGLRFITEDLSKGKLPGDSVSVGPAIERRLVIPDLAAQLTTLQVQFQSPLHLCGSSKHNSHLDQAAILSRFH
jgi:hypothetical protein